MPVVALDPSNARTWPSSNALKLAQSMVTVVALSGPDSRVTVMLVILVVSMIAVSFPAVSSSGMVQVPNILFFIGKHFGTGVILATAFIHLLPDSFSSLLDEAVERKYGNVGRWVGLIILGSLLTIFLVEYISTTFVDHLQAEPSAPPSPQLTPRTAPTPFPPPTALLQEPTSLLPFLANSPKIMRLHFNCKCRGGMCICVPEPVSPTSEQQELLPCQDERAHGHQEGNYPDHSQHHIEQRRRIGRRRQIVGIFVLQVGIMIHSLVIGLTLSIASGADFASLTTAIIFHQIFEGLSLGIRIAALPPAESKEEKRVVEGDDAPSIGELEGLAGIERPDLPTVQLMRAPVPPLKLSASTPGEESSSSRSSSNSKTIIVRPTSERSPKARRSHNTESGTLLDWRGWGGLFGRRSSTPLAHHHHDGYGSTSHNETESNERSRPPSYWRPDTLKTTLSVLFAITTPLGMVLGLTLWKGRENEIEQSQMKLIQGVMSAISAGMLIYAATVEMIAGDFVFGDLEGPHHHHHGGEHNHHDERAEHDGHADDHEHQHEHGHHPSIGKRATAVASLLLGVVAMVLIGLGEPNEH